MDQNNRLDFLIVGSQKSGTTALDQYLREHSEVEMGVKKELHFFDNDSFFMNRVNYDDYHKNFLSNKIKIKGESTPIYMYWNPSIPRIYEYNPNIKIIAILRNPITRAFSHWNMERDRDADSELFSIAIRKENDRCRASLPLQHRVYSYTDRGFYSEQIRRIWRFFPKKQTLFIKHDDLKNKPLKVLQNIAIFLDIPPFEQFEEKNIHSRPYINTLSDDDYKFLHDLYYEEIKTIERMLNWDCSEWLLEKKSSFFRWFT